MRAEGGEQNMGAVKVPDAPIVIAPDLRILFAVALHAQGKS